MFKRLFWLILGTIVGLSSSFWAQRRIRRTVERFYPERVARKVSASASTLVEDVRAALADGRMAMRQREESLRALGPPAQRAARGESPAQRAARAQAPAQRAARARVGPPTR